MNRAVAIGIVFGSISISAVAESPASKPAPQGPAGKANSEEIRTTFMFVQTASSGSFTPLPDKPGHFKLDLKGVSPQTIFFSDRPERIAGQAPTDKFLKGLGFPKEDPPNAAVSLLQAGEETDVVVVELLNPKYDARQATLSYEVTVLKNQGEGLAFLAKKADEKLPSSFSNASLFIDDCPNGVVCVDDCAVLGNLPDAGTCWSWEAINCIPCSQDPDSQLCNQMFPDCQGDCVALSPGIFGLTCSQPPSL